ncbi:hypothetical protein V6N12_050083 [Hibiscus sabdariffa]|uniref:Uncharacterized protein n=1 Tax=Hibiscus sabdariffa TaxID=183260 RepID=A0ABR2GCI8_9ROSI
METQFDASLTSTETRPASIMNSLAGFHYKRTYAHRGALWGLGTIGAHVERRCNWVWGLGSLSCKSRAPGVVEVLCSWGSRGVV